MKTKSILFLPLIALLGAGAGLGACSANSIRPEAAAIEMGNERPQNCRYLGEAVGSQGNFITGDITSNANLVAGARNELRNKAADMGGNYVQVVNSANAAAAGSNGTTNSTVVGSVFFCPAR